MTLFAVAAVLGPIVGPTLGGWLCVDYNWRWIFLINVPIGLFALLAAFPTVEDPDYIKKEVAGLRGKPLNFDYIGLGLLSLVMACWEITLSKGQEWDWLHDPVGRVQALVTLFAVGLLLLVVREMRTKEPIINFRVLKDRNLSISCVILFFAFAVVYGSSIALPGLLQRLFNYDALQSGLVMSPSGVTSMAAMILVGILMGRRADARWLVAIGLLIMAGSSYWMARMNLQISPAQAAYPRMGMTLGLGLLFSPISVAAYKYIPPHLRGAAVGLASLLRTEGGSVGTSMASTIETRREQFHLSRLTDTLGGLNEHVREFLSNARLLYLQSTGDPARSPQMGLQQLDNLRQQQAISLAYFDVFWVCAVVSLAMVVLVLFMKRSVAEPGEHFGGE
jgi:DHA2 family multidrug resistance protein